MEKKDIQAMIIELPVKKDIRVIIENPVDYARIKDHLRRSEKLGYRFVYKMLYDNVCYIEKLKEGNKMAYLSKIR